MTDTPTLEEVAAEIRNSVISWLGGNTPTEPTLAILTALTEAYERGQRDVMQWQPIETAPKDTELLVFMPRNNGNKTVANAEISSLTGQCWAKHVGAMRPTHWMPLPEPTNSEKEGG